MAMRDYKFTLVANVPRSLNVAGNYFGVITATGRIDIQFDDGVFIKRREGMGGSADYQRVTIKSDTDQIVTIALGSGTMYDGRATISGATFNVTVSNANSSPNTPDVTIPSKTTVQVVGANTNRKKVMVFAGVDNIENLRVGCNSSVGVDNGAILAPGGNGDIETRTGVWVYNPGDNNETVSLIDLETI
jgi:hypothetical protein